LVFPFAQNLSPIDGFLWTELLDESRFRENLFYKDGFGGFGLRDSSQRAN